MDCVKLVRDKCPNAKIANWDQSGGGGCWCQYKSEYGNYIDTTAQGGNYINYPMECFDRGYTWEPEEVERPKPEVSCLTEEILDYGDKCFVHQDGSQIMVRYNGYDFATLDFTDPNEWDQECQHDPLLVPAGWSLVQTNVDDYLVEVVAASFPWGTHVVTGTHRGFNKATCPDCSPNHQLTVTNDGVEYYPNTCADRVFITRQIPAA